MDSPHAISQKILIYPQVALWSANINPVSTGWHVSKESFFSFQKLGKQTILKGMVFPGGDEIQYFRFQNIGAGINRVAGYFSLFRLLEKSTNASIAFRFYQA